MEPRNRRPLLTDADKKEIAAQVAKECGRLIPTDDPLFDLVVVNECVLRRTVENLGDRLTSSLVGELDRVLSAHLDQMHEKLSRDVDEKVRGFAGLYGVAVTRLDRRAQLWLWGLAALGIFAMALVSGLVRWPF
ncbi:MAG: hypothetical protein WBR56_00620 [Sedimenticolaceae bacterium]